ncbi:MerR family transcriptional regulator [Sphingomonas sp. AOB5]|uniref:MerR family transcriptional regulator n=1 Tax=Sphingomonas sp. AOB5 TaxID=3034017 RepID=UPI0023F70A9D|nr:MerR family transcriptional regulator [Sphingomonas sp. AOB5]MDF7774176.1 MerR family transcriptional regulator [Sphingomonas sp. AOB5]
MERLTFTASEVARLAGFKTNLMLNYLERSGTFVRENGGPAHHGKWRAYTFRDLVVLRAINRLLELGSRPKRVSEAIATFVRVTELPYDIDSLAEFARKASLFVVSKDRVTYCEPEQLVELTQKGQLAFSFMVDNRSVLEPVVGAVSHYFNALDNNQPRNVATLERSLRIANFV